MLTNSMMLSPLSWTVVIECPQKNRPFLRLSVLFSSKHTVLYKMQRALGSAQTSTTVAAEIGT